jgi:hypothetical protein
VTNEDRQAAAGGGPAAPASPAPASPAPGGPPVRPSGPLWPSGAVAGGPGPVAGGPEPGAPATSSRAWPMILAAVAVLALLGAGVGGVLGGLARDRKSDTHVTTQGSPAASPTPEPSESGPTQCTSDCPTQGPDNRTRTTTVPQVVGHDEAGARSRLKDRGLGANVKYVCDEPASAGTVTAQSPRGETQVNVGSNVSLQVRGVTVLNVVGQYHADAKARLEEAGFTVVVNNKQNGAAGGAVTSQSPAGNACVKVGSTVTLNVGQTNASSSPSTNG